MWSELKAYSTIKSTGWESVDTSGYWFGLSSSSSLVVADCADIDNCAVRTVGTATCVTGNFEEIRISTNSDGASYDCDVSTTPVGAVLIITVYVPLS